MPDRPDMKHPQDQATIVICEVASTTLESVARQGDFEQMTDRLGQAMGLLSELAYKVLDLQNPSNTIWRHTFQTAFDKGRETAAGIVEMVADPVDS